MINKNREFQRYKETLRLHDAAREREAKNRRWQQEIRERADGKPQDLWVREYEV